MEAAGHSSPPPSAPPPGPPTIPWLAQGVGGGPAAAPSEPAAQPRVNRRDLDSKRLAARVIDALLIGLPCYLVVRGVAAGESRLSIWGISAALILTYFFLCESWSGQTIGKHVLGLRVMSTDYGPAPAKSIAARTVLRVLEEPFLALVVMVASGRRRQRIGDLAAGTIVAREDECGERPPPSRLRLVYPVLWIGAALAFAAFGPGSSRPLPPGVYPPAPSKAEGMTPRWRAFADEVDRTCATNFNYGQLRIDQLWREARVRGVSERKTNVGAWELQAQAQTATYRGIRALGTPPAKPGLFARWRDNVGLRGRLMHRVSESLAAADLATADEISGRILRLKVTANRLGQRFGLRICTSNGPGREPVR